MTGRPVDPATPALPQVVYEAAANQDAPLSTGVYGVDDAKFHLNVAMDDGDDDARLGVLVGEAIGELEAVTGCRFVDRTLTAEYGSQPAAWRVAEIPSSNVRSVTSVHRVNVDGTETLLASADYDVFWRDGLPLVRLKPATQAFAAGAGIVAKVAFVAGIGVNSRVAQLARAALNEMVGYAFAAGVDTIDPRSKKSFKRILDALRETSGERMASIGR